MTLTQRMYAKGWSTEELDHLEHHVNLAHANKSPQTIFAERFMYWSYMLVLVVTITAFAEFFLLFLSYVPVLLGNLCVAFVAGSFAALFGHVLHTLDDLSHGHHALVIGLAVFTTLASSWLIARQSMRFGILFAVTFSLLYSYYWYKSHERTAIA